MERNHELVLPNLVKWNGPLTHAITLDSSINFITLSFTFHISVCFYHLDLQDVCFPSTYVHFLHLQENLVYITCKDAISPDLIYYIMKDDSVFMRSIYQLDGNTLLVDLNVPTGELDYNLTSTLIEVCNKFFTPIMMINIFWKHI